MAEYGFKRKECYCGLDLTGQKAEVARLWRDTQPVGKCPNPECGRELLLDAPPVMPSTEPPEAEATAADTKRSRKSKE
jgi:hypothetical protein